MKPIITLFILSVLTTVYGYAQPDTVYLGPFFEETDRLDTTYFRVIQERFPNGWYSVNDYYADTKTIQSKGPTFDDKNRTQGKTVGYYREGQIEFEGTFKDGQNDSVWVEYHPNGNLKSKRTYVDGKVDGLSVQYYSNGGLFSEVQFKNGVKHGPWKMYHDDSLNLLQIDMNYINGAEHGEAKEFYTNGVLQDHKVYDDGKIVSWKCYTKEGKDTACLYYSMVPRFPGLTGCLMDEDDYIEDYLASDKQFSQFRQKHPTNGKVGVLVFFDKRARIYKTQVINSLGPLADKEALRLISKMPAFTPATDELGKKPIPASRLIEIDFNNETYRHYRY